MAGALADSANNGRICGAGCEPTGRAPLARNESKRDLAISRRDAPEVCIYLSPP
jgi:hypothetical protein